MKLQLLLLTTCVFTLNSSAQDDLTKLLPDSTLQQHQPVIATFKSPQLINGQSVETAHRHDLIFMVQHRFGDIAGRNGGAEELFGLDNSSDILIGFNYGVSDRLSAGFGRVKGAPNGTSTSQKQLVYLNLKYRLLQQTTDNYMPLSLTLFGNAAVSAMSKLPLATSDAAFTGINDRMSFIAQAIMARKWNEAISVSLSTTYVRRNFVPFREMNDSFAAGIGARVKVSKRMALIGEYIHHFRSARSKDYFKTQNDFRFYQPLGLGLEIETGGHVFNMIFTNATALLENQFIPSTSSTWTKGEFRWGFSISRTFTLFQSKNK